MASKKPVGSLTKQATTAVARGVSEAARKAQMTQIIIENTGWRGAELETTVAIMLRESRGNPDAYNGNAKTGDDSYGLFQINMKDKLGPARLKLFGITDKAQLLDAATNARAAYALYKSSGNTFHPWLGYRAGLTVSKQSQEAKALLSQVAAAPAKPTSVAGAAAGLRGTTPLGTLTSPLGGGRVGSPWIAARSAPTAATTAAASSAANTLAGYDNGRIPANMLVAIPGGSLESHAATAYQQMLADATAQGIPLGVTDSYRSYDQQVSLVQNKGLYSQGGLGATPGTSQHGWGQAIDVKGGPAVLAWMKANAAKYGFTADTPREDWHFTYTGPGAVAPRTQRGTTSPTPARQDAHGNGQTTPDPTEATMRGQLGWMSAFLDMPVVGDILRQSVLEDWDPARLQGELMDTEWWQTTQDTAREFDGLMGTDPATLNAQISSKMQEIQAQAASLGFSIDPGHTRDLAVAALRLGMNEQQIAHAIGGEASRAGTLATSGTYQTVGSMVNDYGIPMSDQAINNWTQQIAVGTATQEDLREQLVAQAKGLYPGFSDGLDRGLSVKTLADPYVQIAAQNLRLSPEAIRLSDAKWAGSMQGTDPKTGSVRLLGLDEYQKKIRSDPNYGWQNTDDARGQAYAFASKLGQAFGVYAGTGS